MAKKAIKPTPRPRGKSPTLGQSFTAEEFSRLAAEDQARGLLPPWPIPPNPVPADWWSVKFASWLAAFGPITIRPR